MNINTQSKNVIIDGSRLIIEASVSSGASVFVGYPITPANWLYEYAEKRFPVFLPAPDEITTLQWLSGFSATGKMGVTATSFPGFALMIETVNMAYLMELPMLIVLAQRLGPSTGSATAGAQGDLTLLKGCISGGFPLPVFCPSDFKDCWDLTNAGIKAAIELRTPVVLLTSKEMVMTNKSFDLNELQEINEVDWKFYDNGQVYKPYLADEITKVPPFSPLGNDKHLVRINSSTHDTMGFIQKATKEALDNTIRLKSKVEEGMKKFNYFDYIKRENADTLIITYGISSDAVRDALPLLNENGNNISVLYLKTLLPFPQEIFNIISTYKKIFIVEENLTGLLKEIVFGIIPNEKIYGINKFGDLITPQEIINKICNPL